MIKIDKQHHKIIRTSPAWGDWEYEYHERRQQERKARQWMKGRKKKNDGNEKAYFKGSANQPYSEKKAKA